MSGSGSGSRRSTGQSGCMPTEVDIGWQHCTQIGNNRRKVRCVYCNKIVSSGVTRLKEHLGGVTGNVAPCTQVPKEVRIQMRDHVTQSRIDKEK